MPIEPVSGPPPEKIHRMFTQVAAGYDRANNVLSAGIHHLWRRRLVRWSGAATGTNVLDCATGTGDLAIEFKKVVGSGRVVATDFCEEMLITAPAKARQLGLDIAFSVADVTALPFADASFDLASISFGIRNVGDPIKGLAEMTRVLRPGGCLMVLEFGRMDLPMVGALYNWYADKVLPRLGGWLTGQHEAYRYLQESSAAFPCREDFLALMKQAGDFSTLEYRPVSGGVAYIYKATKRS